VLRALLAGQIYKHMQVFFTVNLVDWVNKVN